VQLLALESGDMDRLTAVASECRLDFDDAYQYIAAERNGVPLVSFDSDFDDTDLGRLTPQQVLVWQEDRR
jgi:uncharacterized protein